MRIKKVLTANLKPGMVSAEAAYTSSNHMVIQGDTTLTPEIINKLKYYAVRSVKVYATTEAVGNAAAQEGFSLDGGAPTYFERIQQTEQFIAFKNQFTESVGNFTKQINDFVLKNDRDIVDNMLHEVGNILSHTRNSLHLLDMMQCLRGFDDLTYMHSMNVALICHVIGHWKGLTPEEQDVLVLCGLLHDIGKLKIPPEIISKPGRLTEEEFALIRAHPDLGYEILMAKDLDSRVMLAALQHHERFNGKGYPKHLTGAEIGKYSAIVAIADVYDAMTSDRVYRKGICPFKVISILEGEQELYDPDILYPFMKRTVEAYINTDVLLSNGEKGKIVLLNQNRLSRPIIITDAKTYDLSKDFSVEIETLI